MNRSNRLPVRRTATLRTATIALVLTFFASVASVIHHHHFPEEGVRLVAAPDLPIEVVGQHCPAFVLGHTPLVGTTAFDSDLWYAAVVTGVVSSPPQFVPERATSSIATRAPPASTSV